MLTTEQREKILKWYGFYYESAHGHYHFGDIDYWNKPGINLDDLNILIEILESKSDCIFKITYSPKAVLQAKWQIYYLDSCENFYGSDLVEALQKMLLKLAEAEK